MSCGKRPVVKLWDKPKKLQVITPSKLEQNEASVKKHWHNVIRSLELSYKDDQFWETQADTVRELVGPAIFERIAKIFDLPAEATKYMPKSEPSSSLTPSEEFYTSKISEAELRAAFSLSGYETEEEEEEEAEPEEQSEVWTSSSMITATPTIDKKMSKLKASQSSKVISTIPQSLSKLLSKTFSRCISRTLSKSPSKMKGVKSEQVLHTPDSSTASGDDVIVQHSFADKYYRVRQLKPNPHFEMLYCNVSETDMIKWESNYKQKVFEVSASDEFSKKAEILTKKIAKEFYDWWVGLGTLEFKSEIKRPEDIEALFQVWFDEHASRGLMLNPKIIPCVLKSIANYTATRRASCRNALKRQIAYDIQAETDPAHLMAFGTSLPHKMKHIPPKNNTEKSWHGVIIPEELRSMSYVWNDIQHLTSTKAFQTWLTKHPNLPMPPCLAHLHDPVDKKQAFQVPSDYFVKSSMSESAQDLALPVSQMSVELKQVLSRLMNE